MRLKLTIKVVNPPTGVLVALQKGKGSARQPDCATITEGDTVLTLEVGIKTLQPLVLTGQYVQKDSKGQFIYLVWGRSAGDFTSAWQRRTKIYVQGLADLSAERLSSADAQAVLLIAGTAKDGGPACATVPVKVE